MTRVATTNYAGSPDTTFEWATAGTDRFSRVKDLYALAQALVTPVQDMDEAIKAKLIALLPE